RNVVGGKTRQRPHGAKQALRLAATLSLCPISEGPTHERPAPCWWLRISRNLRKLSTLDSQILGALCGIAGDSGRLVLSLLHGRLHRGTITAGPGSLARRGRLRRKLSSG